MSFVLFQKKAKDFLKTWLLNKFITGGPFFSNHPVVVPPPAPFDGNTIISNMEIFLLKISRTKCRRKKFYGKFLGQKIKPEMIFFTLFPSLVVPPPASFGGNSIISNMEIFLLKISRPKCRKKENLGAAVHHVAYILLAFLCQGIFH